jgi:hypothetical protein
MNKKFLDIYTDYLICQNQNATATGLSHLLNGDLSHDQITRFLNKEELTSKHLWQYVKPAVRKHEQEEGGVFIFDDTIEEKPYTNENDTVCWHFSHAKGRCVKGINILSGLLRYHDFGLPVAFEAVRKDIHFCDLETKKEKRKASITKNELFRSMLRQAAYNQMQFEYILADNWFGAKKNMEFINYDLEKKFIFGMKSNRLVAFSEKGRKKGQYQNLSSLNLKDKETKTIWLKNMSFPVTVLKRVFRNENGTTGSLYLITNDLNLDADQIYNIYQKRWRVEEYHKSIKQNASLEKSPTKVSRSQRNHIFASIIAYCKLEFLRAKTALNHFALKYKLIVRANQMAYQELQKISASA